jgi:hypothetical protein
MCYTLYNTMRGSLVSSEWEAGLQDPFDGWRAASAGCRLGGQVNRSDLHSGFAGVVSLALIVSHIRMRQDASGAHAN